MTAWKDGKKIYALAAQWFELPTYNRVIVGSNPTQSTRVATQILQPPRGE